MNKSIICFCVLSLTCFNLMASEMKPDDPPQFPLFTHLPLEIQLNIINEADQPHRFLQLNKRLRVAVLGTYLANWSDEAIKKNVSLALNSQRQVMNDSRLLRELDRPLAFELISRLLHITKPNENKEMSSTIRGILMRYLESKPGFVKDKIIELSRRSLTIQKEAIQLLRDSLPSKIPVIHSAGLPEAYKAHMNGVQFYSASSLGDRKITTWVFPKGVNLPKFNTLSIAGGEDILTNEEE